MFQKDDNLIGFLKKNSFFDTPSKKNKPSANESAYFNSARKYHPNSTKNRKRQQSTDRKNIHYERQDGHAIQKQSNLKKNIDMLEQAFFPSEKTHKKDVIKTEESTTNSRARFQSSKLQSKQCLDDLSKSLKNEIYLIDHQINGLNEALQTKFRNQFSKLQQKLHELIQQLLEQQKKQLQYYLNQQKQYFNQQLYRIKIVLEKQQNKVKKLQQQFQNNWKKVTAQLLSNDYENRIEQIIKESKNIQLKINLKQKNNPNNIYYNLKKCLKDSLNINLHLNF